MLLGGAWCLVSSWTSLADKDCDVRWRRVCLSSLWGREAFLFHLPVGRLATTSYCVFSRHTWWLRGSTPHTVCVLGTRGGDGEDAPWSFLWVPSGIEPVRPSRQTPSHITQPTGPRGPSSRLAKLGYFPILFSFFSCHSPNVIETQWNYLFDECVLSSNILTRN